MAIKRFNVRVYGVLINERKEVLVADERIKGSRTTKFPGGGVELGEGLRDALCREFMEECRAVVVVGEHLYTTDFFVPSAFDNDSQIISVYYFCHCADWHRIQTSDQKFAYVPVDDCDAEAFRWVKIQDLPKESEVNLPIDKVVVDMLIKRYN